VVVINITAFIQSFLNQDQVFNDDKRYLIDVGRYYIKQTNINGGLIDETAITN